MSFKDVLAAVQLAGAATPAFGALFAQAIKIFTPAEQDELKSAYETAKARSDQAQADFDDASRGK